MHKYFKTFLLKKNDIPQKMTSNYKIKAFKTITTQKTNGYRKYYTPITHLKSIVQTMHPHSFTLVRLQTPQIPLFRIHRILPTTSVCVCRQPISATIRRTFAALRIIATARSALTVPPCSATAATATMRVIAVATGRTGIGEVGRIEQLHLQARTLCEISEISRILIEFKETTYKCANCESNRRIDIFSPDVGEAFWSFFGDAKRRRFRRDNCQGHSERDSHFRS